MDGVSGQRSRRRTLPPHGVANMSLPHINDTTQRRASAVCELQDTSAVMTTVDTETFEPQNVAQYVLHDGGWMLIGKSDVRESGTMETTENPRMHYSEKKLVCVHQRSLVLTLTVKVYYYKSCDTFSFFQIKRLHHPNYRPALI